MKLFELGSMAGYRHGDELDPRSPDFEGPDYDGEVHTIQSKIEYEIDGRDCVLISSVDISTSSGGIGYADIRTIDSIKVQGVQFENGTVLTPEQVTASFGPEALDPATVKDAVGHSLDM